MDATATSAVETTEAAGISQVAAATERLSQVIERAGKQTELLEERLQPYLSPMESAVLASERDTVAVPVAAVLHRQADDLESVVRRLGILRDCFEG